MFWLRGGGKFFYVKGTSFVGLEGGQVKATLSVEGIFQV